jgi:hypothetical protein
MRVSRQRYNDAQMTDENSLAKALVAAPAKLTPVLTFLGGKTSNKSPLVTLTEGVRNTETINRSEFEYDVMEEFRYTRNLSATVSGAAAGRGGAIFHLTFPDKWFVNQYVLVSKSRVQVRIMGEPVPDGNNWRYPVRLISPDPEAVMPASDLVAGSAFGQMFAPVGTDFSRGNASNWEAPGKVRHKLTTIRKSYSFSGKAKEFVAEFELPTKSGGTSKYWMDFEEWQYILQWNQEKEMLLWYGEQSYNEQGLTQLKDPDTGQPIVIGPGVLEQIQNKDTYSRLTAAKLRSTVRDLYFGMADKADAQQVVLYTGTGGAEEFDRAIKDELDAKTYAVLDQGKFVTGSGNNLELGGFFTTYRHIDGHTITITKVPAFDRGPVADASEKHPETGLPMESYRMVMLDQSSYEGEPNVVAVKRQGREFLKWYVAGSVTPPGFDAKTASRASDIDGASVHMLAESGVCLRRFNTSIDLQCRI